MNWLRKWLDSMRGKSSPEAKAEPQIGDPNVESKHLNEEDRRRREGEMENGEGRRLEEV
jgi:hypothetical protein